MDIASLAGIGAAFVAIFLSMILEGSSPVALINIPAMMLVIVGTLGATMASGLLKDIKSTPMLMKRALTAKPDVGGDVVAVMVKLADTARREGLLALEDAARDVEDPFLKRGLEFAIDGTDQDVLRDILESEVAAKKAHDHHAAKIFADMGGFSPTLGIIGTVVGLVHVLENLSSPQTLGPMIAGAFVATLWGILLANIVYLPLSNRLKRLSELECRRMELIIEGIIAIQSGVNPRLVQQKLQSLMPSPAEPEKDKAEAA